MRHEVAVRRVERDPRHEDHGVVACDGRTGRDVRAVRACCRRRGHVVRVRRGRRVADDDGRDDGVGRGGRAVVEHVRRARRRRRAETFDNFSHVRLP